LQVEAICWRKNRQPLSNTCYLYFGGFAVVLCPHSGLAGAHLAGGGDMLAQEQAAIK